MLTREIYINPLVAFRFKLLIVSNQNTIENNIVPIPINIQFSQVGSGMVMNSRMKASGKSPVIVMIIPRYVIIRIRFGNSSLMLLGCDSLPVAIWINLPGNTIDWVLKFNTIVASPNAIPPMRNATPSPSRGSANVSKI